VHTSTLPLAPFRLDIPLHFAPFNIETGYTSLASCYLKNGFRRFVPHVIRYNNQFPTP